MAFLVSSGRCAHLGRGTAGVHAEKCGCNESNWAYNLRVREAWKGIPVTVAVSRMLWVTADLSFDIFRTVEENVC